MTYTVATLEVSASAYNEIADKLRAAGYDQCFDEAGMIDMTHIGLVKAAESDDSKELQVLAEYGSDRHGSKIRQGDSMPYAVSNDLYWRYDSAPRGVKLFLLSVGGVAIAPGPWRDGAGFIGWHELFKRDKAQEERLGIR